MISTEVTVVGGSTFLVEGPARTIEKLIIAGSRGSIMELVWLREAGTGAEVAVNPDHVVALRQLD